MLDMAILSKCNHSIISHGTYSFWSAYLKPKGQTLYVNGDYDKSRSIINEDNDIEWIPWKDPEKKPV